MSQNVSKCPIFCTYFSNFLLNVTLSSWIYWTIRPAAGNCTPLNPAWLRSECIPLDYNTMYTPEMRMSFRQTAGFIAG